MTRRGIPQLIAVAFTIAALAASTFAADKPAKKTAAEQAAEKAADLPPSNYSAASGDKPVGAIPDAVLRDEKRQKDVELTIEYPIAPGSYPLIVWSHAAGASNRNYVGLTSFWASHGYVVIKPNHADAGKQNAAKDAAAAQSLGVADWKNRVQDLVFVLDAIAQIEDKFPELKGKIDTAHTAVGGHADGALTAMLLGGAKTFPGATSYADARVKALILMSPQGPSETRGLTAESFAGITVPTLFLTGTADKGAVESETPEWRRKSYELTPAGDKWLVVLNGASQATFTGRVGGAFEGRDRSEDVIFPDVDPTRDPRMGGYDGAIRVRSPRDRDPLLSDRAIFARAKAISVAFWDTYLHGNAKGREFLDQLNGRRNIEMVTK
jgi:predicted dienelactone hydrolase